MGRQRSNRLLKWLHSLVVVRAVKAYLKRLLRYGKLMFVALPGGPRIGQIASKSTVVLMQIRQVIIQACGLKKRFSP